MDAVASGSTPYSPHTGLCCSCLQISGWHVVGAALESPNSFRVWYCTPTQPIPPSSSSSSTKPGSTPHPRFKLQKTLPFTCSSGSEATALVQAVRQAAAWHGRQAAPRVLAVINPKSGQGRCALAARRLGASILLITTSSSQLQVLYCMPVFGMDSLCTLAHPCTEVKAAVSIPAPDTDDLSCNALQG